MPRREGPRTFLPRALASSAGLVLASLAAFGWYLAHLLLGAVAQGDQALTGAGDSTTELLHASGDGVAVQSALAGASSVERFGHTVLGNVSSATEQFQMMILLSVFAGALAVAVAVRGRPSHRWPEVVWVVAAVLALAPGVLLHLWLFVAGPLAAVIALAACMHLTRRHDLTIARGTAAARRGSELVAPHAQAAVSRTTAGASRTLDAGREQLPAARAQAEAIGRQSKALAAPVARAAVDKLRRNRGGSPPNP